MAEVKPLPSRIETLRLSGLRIGEIAVPEDFDAALPEDIVKAFEGKRNFCSIRTFISRLSATSCVTFYLIVNKITYVLKYCIRSLFNHSFSNPKAGSFSKLNSKLVFLTAC